MNKPQTTTNTDTAVVRRTWVMQPNGKPIIVQGEIKRLEYQFNDGGRADAGFSGRVGDCVARSIAIASGRPYKEVYDRLAIGNATQRRGKYNGRAHGQRTARNGIMTNRTWFKNYMRELGFVWVSTMGIGTGCTTHLRADEIPMHGRLVVNVSRHMVAVIDGVINDTFNPDRHGTRCVYGYWIKPDTDKCAHTVCDGDGKPSHYWADGDAWLCDACYQITKTI